MRAPTRTRWRACSGPSATGANRTCGRCWPATPPTSTASTSNGSRRWPRSTVPRRPGRHHSRRHPGQGHQPRLLQAVSLGRSPARPGLLGFCVQKRRVGRVFCAENTGVAVAGSLLGFCVQKRRVGAVSCAENAGVAVAGSLLGFCVQKRRVGAVSCAENAWVAGLLQPVSPAL